MDKKDRAPTKYGPTLSIANTKYIHYNDDVLLPFILSVCIAFRRKPKQPIPDLMTVISSFDGGIPQLEPMLCNICEAIGISWRIICNT